jgi:Ca2+-binding EF-hand superfamily protein
MESWKLPLNLLVLIVPVWLAFQTSKTKTAEVPEKASKILDALHEIAVKGVQRDSFVHRGITCNGCQAFPIRGVRFKCINCPDFDLCERCESTMTMSSSHLAEDVVLGNSRRSVHSKTHVFMKIVIPIGPMSNPRVSMVKEGSIYPGNDFFGGMLSETDGTDRWEMISKFQSRGIEMAKLEALFEVFSTLSTRDGITKEVFKSCFGQLKHGPGNIIAERCFFIFDFNNDGIIDFEDYVNGMLLVDGKATEKDQLDAAFRTYDVDSDGRVTREELQILFKAYLGLGSDAVERMIQEIDTLESVEPVEPSALAEGRPKLKIDASVRGVGGAMMTPLSPVSPMAFPTSDESTEADTQSYIHALQRQALMELSEKFLLMGGEECLVRGFLDHEAFFRVAAQDWSIVSWVIESVICVIGPSCT